MPSGMRLPYKFLTLMLKLHMWLCDKSVIAAAQRAAYIRRSDRTAEAPDWNISFDRFTC